MNKRFKKVIPFVLSLMLVLSFGTAVYANNHIQGPGGGGDEGGPGGGGDEGAPGNVDVEITLDNPFTGGDNLMDLLRSIINGIILPIGGVLVVLAFIYTGFLFVTSRGDEAGIKKAKRYLLYTVIGTALLLGSWVIAEVLRTTINQLRAG